MKYMGLKSISYVPKKNFFLIFKFYIHNNEDKLRKSCKNKISFLEIFQVGLFKVYCPQCMDSISFFFFLSAFGSAVPNARQGAEAKCSVGYVAR